MHVDMNVSFLSHRFKPAVFAKSLYSNCLCLHMKKFDSSGVNSDKVHAGTQFGGLLGEAEDFDPEGHSSCPV